MTALAMLLAALCAAYDGPRFSAEAFLDPEIPRPANWPEALRFEPRSLSDEELDKNLQGLFKASASCDGRPIPLKTQEANTGFFRPGMLVQFEKGLPTALVFPPKGLGIVKPPTSEPLAECGRTRGADGRGVTFGCRQGETIIYMRVVPAAVTATGEIVFVDYGLKIANEQCAGEHGVVFSALSTQ